MTWLETMRAAQQRAQDAYYALMTRGDGHEDRARRCATSWQNAIDTAKLLPGWILETDADAVRAVISDQFQRAVDEWSGGSGLWIGPSGSGKTTAAVLLVRLGWDRAVAEKVPATCVCYAKATDLATCRRRHGLGVGDAPLVEQAKAAGLTILDDLGQESRTGDTAIWEVVDDRYERGRPTLVTSGLMLARIQELYGEQFIRRLVEGKSHGHIFSAFAVATP